MHGPDGHNGVGLREEVRSGCFADEGWQQEEGTYEGERLAPARSVQ